MSEELARLTAEVRMLRYVLEDVRDMIQGYAGQAKGVREAIQIIDEALGDE